MRRGDGPAAKRAQLPDFVPPSLATLSDTPPSGANWIHEIKLDGYRIEARLDHGKVRLFTRNRQDWTHRFKSIADAVAKLPAETALLDGELVAQNEKGFSSFSLLQTDLKEGRSERLVYWVFDLLHLDGRDLTEQPLTRAQGRARTVVARRRFRRPDPLLRTLSRATAPRSSSAPARWSLRASSRSGATRRIGPAVRTISSRPNVTTSRNSWSPALVRRAPCRKRSAP